MGKRKTPYIAGKAQLDFKPDYDWEIEDAKRLFENPSNRSIPLDSISYRDCIEGMKTLPDGAVDLVIADPPFGINFDGKGSQYNRNEELVVEDYGEIEFNYPEFSQEWITQLPRIMKDTASAYLFSGWTNLNDLLNALQKTDLTVINHLIWKYQFGVFTKKKFVTSHYHILFVVKNPKQYFFNKFEHYPLDIWEIPRTYLTGQKKNGTKLPEELVMRAIHFSSKPGDVVFDPFMGNGTTAVAAKMTYRHYFGFEKNEKMKSLIEDNIKAVEAGCRYQPYRNYVPSQEDLIKKYPHIKKYLEEQQDISNNSEEK